MNSESINVLAVPMHLDALFVAGRSDAVAPMVDFSKLPYARHGQDHNPTIPWLGEAIASRPFEGEQPLSKGVHLHWALPDALCRARREDTHNESRSFSFPTVPDRWLITRRMNVNGNPEMKQWVVESNYLYPVDVPPSSPAISYPYPSNLLVPKGEQPFRYMGRAVPLESAYVIPSKKDVDQYLAESLTALGYGAPSFAAFYPNCKSVFGFHDEEVMELPNSGLSYEVLGWYENKKEDYLYELLHPNPAPLLTEAPSIPDVLKGLGWSTDAPSSSGEPRLVCQARLVFSPQVEDTERTPNTVNITFGNTTVEALSAYLSVETTPNDKIASAKLEDQLEAVLLGSQLDHRQTDLADKFKEARHAKGFTTTPPAFLWVVRLPESNSSSDESLPDWPDVEHLLDQINVLQREYNAAWDEISQMRRNVADDWHKYMQCAHPPEGLEDQYPDPDVVLHLIKQRSLPELENLIAATGEIICETKEVSGASNVFARSQDSLPGSLAVRIEALSTALHACLDSHASGTTARFLLLRVVAPRFFQPTEPVVLLTGSGVARSAHRFDRTAGKDGTKGELNCSWLTSSLPLAESLELVCDALTANKKWEQHDWTGAPWHPLLMEWEIELRPFTKLANQRDTGRHYHPDFIASNFSLKPDNVDLIPQADKPLLMRRARVYRGSSLLTPHGVDPYIEGLTRALARTDASERFSQEMKDRLNEILDTLSNTHAMAQSLSGFNDALIMNKQVLQLPIDDPLGFPDERGVAERVRNAIGDGVHRSPQPDHDYSPIRAGELRLTKLRLVDTFGQIQDVDCTSCRHASTLPPSPVAGAAVMLPARLVQPARLNFRWLAARHPSRETSTHPDTSPICAWVMANHIDQCLFFYAADGEALGYLETEGMHVRWRSAPGRATPIVHLDPEIGDRALRQLLRFLLACSETYFVQLLKDLEAAQDLIEPEEFGDALLMGRPLALVRASLQLELQASPVPHLGWHQFVDDLQRGHRTRDAFTSVRFPVRLGEQGQLGDGLAVYFEEDGDGAYDGYVIPAYEQAGDYGVDPAITKCDFLYVSVAAPPLKITMLVDPRGVVHATSGVLPVKAINIPAHQYRQAIQRIEMSFLAAPVLVDRTTEALDVAIPVAHEAGETWSFIETRGGAQTVRPIRPSALNKPFNAPVAIREGWLRVTHTSPKLNGDQDK